MSHYVFLSLKSSFSTSRKVERPRLPYLLFKIVAIDTLLGKRSLIIKIKTRVVTNINIAIFRFIHKSFSRKKKKIEN